MKKNVVEFVYYYLNFQKLEIEHQKLSRLMQPLSIPEWKWDNISIDFVVGFRRHLREMIRFWLWWINRLNWLI